MERGEGGRRSREAVGPRGSILSTAYWADASPLLHVSKPVPSVICLLITVLACIRAYPSDGRLVQAFPSSEIHLDLTSWNSLTFGRLSEVQTRSSLVAATPVPPIALDISVNKFNPLAHLRGISSVRSVRVTIIPVMLTDHRPVRQYICRPKHVND